MDRGAAPLSPERWRKIEELFLQALDLPVAERDERLARACGEDDELREAVRALLASHETLLAEDAGPAAFLGELDAVRSQELLDATRSVLEEGSTIGAYRVVRELGRGGMGTVYLAERADGQFRKRVALKVVSHRLHIDDRIVRRFLEERQIVASLEHPGIARLLDGGVTTNGLPWFAMEYVEGEPIDRYCETRRLTLGARLELFCHVCDAVHYAHRNSVVHRDLKPTNVLVANEAQVKLLDFGIAKLTAERESDEPRLTRPGAQPMTPEYASPEQFSGGAISPASDVYSLGVILYELAVGRHPYQVAGLSSEAIERVVLEDEPERPSRIVPGFAPGLDAIIMKALHKEPQQRYDTAGELAADLRRHLVAEPVHAGAKPRSLRLTRVALAGLLLAVVAFVLVRGNRSRVPPPAAPLIAVVPFVPAVPDSALARLGRDLVVTMSAALDGLGDLRTVDALTILAQTSDRSSAPTLGSDVALARRLRATGVMRGGLVRVGRDVRVDATLHPTSGAAPVHAFVVAPPDDIARLTDSLTWSLLRQLWREQTPPTPSAGAITTRSLPALRAFLDGERLISEGRFRRAPEAFSRAIAADSTFWLAYWRYAQARDWWSQPVDSGVRAAYVAHRFQFPERDRLLIEAQMTDSSSVRLTRMRSLVSRFPDYWLGWFVYADALVHDAPFLGSTRAVARSALERTTLLNPSLNPAWQHLFWLAARDRDTTASRRALVELTRLRYDSSRSEEIGHIGPLLFYRCVDLEARSSGAPNTECADAGATALLTYRGAPEELDAGMGLYGFHRAGIEFSNRVLRLAPPAELADPQRRALAMEWAARGAWDSTLVAADRYVTASPSALAMLYRYRLLAVGAWLGAVDPAALLSRRSAIAVAELSAVERAELAWVDGVVALTNRDRAALAAARASLRSTDSVSAPILDRSLEAFDLELAGSRARGAQALAALEWRRAEGRGGGYPSLGDRHPFFTAVNRLAASRWLVASGDTLQAARLLTWHEAVLPSVLTGHADATLSALTYLERARLEAGMRRPDAARVFYEEFLRRYDTPVSAHRHLVDEARTAVARLAPEPTATRER